MELLGPLQRCRWGHRLTPERDVDPGQADVQPDVSAHLHGAEGLVGGVCLHPATLPVPCELDNCQEK